MVSFSRPSRWLYVRGSCHELGHTWHPSCVYCACEVLLFVFLEAFKVYLPLYLLSNFRRLRDMRWVLLSLLPNILRSSLFLATNGGAFVAFICLTRRVLGCFYHYSAMFIPCYLASLCAIFVERKSRRGLLAGYVSILAVEVAFSVLKSKGVIKSVPYGEVMIFSLASAVLLHRQRTSKGVPPDAVGSVLSGLLQPPALMKSCSPYRGVAKLLWVGAWGFLCGYSTQTLLSLLSYWKKIMKKTASVKDWLSNKHSVKFGLFVASFATWFKLSNWLMRVLAVPHDLRLVIAGMVAGLSMMFVRSSAISLYFGYKALEVLYFKAVKKGYAKAWYYGDVLLYAFSTAVIIHGVFFEGHHVREGYWRFIERITRGRLLLLNYQAIDYFGTNASLRPMQFLRRQQSAQNE